MTRSLFTIREATYVGKGRMCSGQILECSRFSSGGFAGGKCRQADYCTFSLACASILQFGPLNGME